MYLTIAWRNIWRNKRRTGVILVAVIIGVWSMIFLSGLMRGVGNQFVKNSISTLTGHIQIHHVGYREDPVVENSMETAEEVIDALEKYAPPGSLWARRIRVSAIANNARHARGLTLVGIEAGSEKKVSFIGNAVREGAYLEKGDINGIIVGKALAELFDTGVGKKLVLMSQDREKEIASRAFRIVGIYRGELESTEKKYAFVNISSASEMMKLGGGLSEISVLLPDQEKTEEVTRALREALPGKKYEVSSWKQLVPLTVAILKMYDWFIFLWFIVVFIAMSFGIVNTTLMAVFERIREFGLLKALGMKPGRIVAEVLTESFVLLLIGTGVGNGLGVLSIHALARKGLDLSSLSAGIEFVGLPRIIYPVVVPHDALIANLVVLILGIIVSIYPALKAARFSPVEAMGHT